MLVMTGLEVQLSEAVATGPEYVASQFPSASRVTLGGHVILGFILSTIVTV
jgi:hypothetical protein